jgi:hypothetical protein
MEMKAARFSETHLFTLKKEAAHFSEILVRLHALSPEDSNSVAVAVRASILNIF